MRLFNEIVLDVWNARLGEAKKLRSKLEAVVRQKQKRLDRIEDAFLHERSIGRQTYERQRDKLREQLSLAEMELSDAVLGDLDVEGVLGFAEHVLTKWNGVISRTILPGAPACPSSRPCARSGC